MRNKAAAKHPIRFLIRRNVFLSLAVLVVVFAVLPLTFLTTGQELSREFTAYILAKPNAETATLTTMANTYLQQMLYTDYRAPILAIAFAGLGVLTALVLNMHRFSRKSAMMNAALPVTRTADFVHRLLTFLVLDGVPMLLCMGITWASASRLSFAPYADFSVLLRSFGILLVIGLYGYAVGSLGAVLTGHLWAAVIAVAVLCFTPELFCCILSSVAGLYLKTMPSTMGLAAQLSWSPCISLCKWLAMPETFAALPGVLAIVLYLTGAWLLSLHRPTEAAGQTLAFAWTDPILTVYLSALGGLMLGILYHTMYAQESLMFLGVVAGVLLVSILCHLCFTLHIRDLLKRWWMPAVSLLLLCAAIFSLRCDLFRYDAYLPERSAIQAVTLSTSVSGSSMDVRMTDEEALDAVYAYAQTLRDSALAQEKDAADGNAVTLTWETTGGTVKRTYRCTRSEDSHTAAAVVAESAGYREGLANSEALQLLENPQEGQELYVSFSGNQIVSWDEDGSWQDIYTSVRAPETLRALREAIQSDIRSRTLAQTQTEPIGTISISGRVSADRWAYYSLNVYASDRSTMEVLFGDQGEEYIDFLSGGYVQEERIIVLKATYDPAASDAEEDYWANYVTKLEGCMTTEESVALVRRSVQQDGVNSWCGPWLQENARILVLRRSDLLRTLREKGVTLPEELPTSDAAWAELIWESRVPIHALPWVRELIEVQS